MITRENILEIKEIIYTNIFSLKLNEQIKLVYCNIIDNSLEYTIVYNNTDFTTIDFEKLNIIITAVKAKTNKLNLLNNINIILEKNFNEELKNNNEDIIRKLTDCDILFCQDKQELNKINIIKDIKTKKKTNT